MTSATAKRLHMNAILYKLKERGSIAEDATVEDLPGYSFKLWTYRDFQGEAFKVKKSIDYGSSIAKLYKITIPERDLTVEEMLDLTVAAMRSH